MSAQDKTQEKTSSTNECGCHCGYIKFSMTLSPPLSEQKVLDCGCSICRRAGYLLLYPKQADVKWHGDSLARCAKYVFNNKNRDHLFCPKCGSSLMIDFTNCGRDDYGVSARTINNVNLSELQYETADGINNIPPKGDMSGMWYEAQEEKK